MEKPGPKTRPAPNPLFGHRLNVAAMSLLILVLVLHLLNEFSAILQQLLVATFLGYLILPAHHWLVRHRLPRRLSFPVLILAFLAGSYGVGQIIYNSLADLVANVPTYQSHLSELIQRVAERIPALNRKMLQQVVVGQTATMESSILMIRSALGSFFSFFTQVIVVLIYLAFLLAEQVSFQRRIGAAFDPVRAEQVMAVVRKINSSIVQYIAVKTLMSLLTGLVTFVMLSLFGVSYPILWGIVTFLLNYIPYLGSVVATLLPSLLALLEFPSPWRAVLVLATLAVVQNGIGYIVEPRIAGSRLNLSPLVIILALAFGGAIWGIVGMILAVPVTVAFKAVLENIDETRPIAVMMSNI